MDGVSEPVPIRKADPSFVDVYKTGFEEGQRAVDAQLSELESMRNRSLVFLAFTGTVTAFLIGTSLRSQDVTGWFYALAGAATGLWVLALLLCLSLLVAPVRFLTMLAPWRWWRPTPEKKEEEEKTVMHWQFRMSARSIVARPNPVCDEKVRRPSSQADIYQALAWVLEGMREYNAVRLVVIRRRYWAFIAVATIQLMLWTALAWMYGTRGA